MRDQAKKLKYAAVIVATLMITVDANAEWNPSKQIGDTIFTPIKNFLNEWNFWMSLVIGGVSTLYEKGDFKKKSIVAVIGFCGFYAFCKLIAYSISRI